ncbi:LLM class flavin-dependent oxidoreductase [Actinomycetes bacterium KLBMP 9797]
MRLGVNLTPNVGVTVLKEAERLGFAAALAPEGLSDAISVIGWAAGQTERMDLVTGVCQIPARAPVLTALTAASLSRLSGGRFRLGLGVSNAHSSRSWYGMDFAGPLKRTREYVAVVRTALRGAEVRHEGEHYVLPMTEADAPGFRMPPAPAAVPIYLGAVGPRSLELVGEIADGWIGVFRSPEQVAVALRRLRAGRERAGAGMDGFDVLLTVPLSIGDDPVALAEPVKPYFARFLSLGRPEENFYQKLAATMGFGEAARRVRDRFVAGDAAGAAAEVPFEFVDGTALLGPPDRIAERMKAYAAAGVTTLCVGAPARSVEGQVDTLRLAMRALHASGA